MKWFHAIGICGKTTANVAKMFKEMGWFVTGSDIQYFPPAYDLILENEIPHVEGYHYSHLTRDFWLHTNQQFSIPFDIPEHPDLVMIVESATVKNKEYLFAKNKGLDVRPFSQILNEYFIKPESVVVIGSAGKTTTTALLTKLLKDAQLDPSYMIAADVKDFKDSLKNTNSEWSVIEGDEYHNIELANGPKFLEYKPKYLVITNIGYEHIEIFPTRELYVEAFKKAVEVVPAEGLILAKANDTNIDAVVQHAKAKVIRYQYIDDISKIRVNKSDYYIVKSNKPNVSNALQQYEIYNAKAELLLEGSVNLLGTYNLENVLAGYILTSKLDLLNIDTFIDSISSFKGPLKRLEILKQTNDIIVFDDFAVAPQRAQNSLETLFGHFSGQKEVNIIAVFEPNAGSRPNDENLFKEIYKNAFTKANYVLLPQLSDFNQSFVDSSKAVTWLNELGARAEQVNVEELEDNITNKIDSSKLNIVIFMSAYRLTTTAHKFAKSLH